ncbi:DUF4258 domain-containing protein [Deltaproteobacteria bacterium TL4]
MIIKELKFSGHAIQRMFERKITKDSVKKVIISGEIIKDYPNDQPYPSMLLLGFEEDRPLHVVLGIDPHDQTGYVVTVYEPDSKLWSTNFKTRRKP